MTSARPDPFESPRPANGLSRDRVVRAAVGLADRQPHGELTMRALATELGVRSPMALYRWVGGSKDGLEDLMVDSAYGEIVVPLEDGWRTGLHELGTSAWATVQRHPWFARLAFSRPPLGPNALTVYDRALGLLEPLSLDAASRIGCLNTILGHVFGAGLALLEETAMRAKTGLATDHDLAAAAAPRLERIVASGHYPHFSRWVGDPARLDEPPQNVERVLDWLLDGLEDLVEPGGDPLVSRGG
jgi:AcrR family transcriptional regulator